MDGRLKAKQIPMTSPVSQEGAGRAVTHVLFNGINNEYLMYLLSTSIHHRRHSERPMFVRCRIVDRPQSSIGNPLFCFS
jgi:hypothetical protein